jgi:hypothetical protein
MYWQQSVQKKYCKAEQYCFGAWGQAETSLTILDFSWKYQKHNEQIKIKRQWLSPWGTSEIHGPFLGSPGPVPIHQMNPLSKALLCTTLDSINPVLYPSIDTILYVLLNMPAVSATAKMSFSVLRRLKTCVSSGIKNDRLSSLGLMHIHLDFEVDVYKVMEVFLSAKTRSAHFWQFKDILVYLSLKLCLILCYVKPWNGPRSYHFASRQI